MQIFSEFGSVTLSDVPITDADLVWLQHQSHITTIYLDHTPITGAGFTSPPVSNATTAAAQTFPC